VNVIKRRTVYARMVHNLERSVTLPRVSMPLPVRGDGPKYGPSWIYPSSCVRDNQISIVFRYNNSHHVFKLTRLRPESHPGSSQAFQSGCI